MTINFWKRHKLVCLYFPLLVAVYQDEACRQSSDRKSTCISFELDYFGCLFWCADFEYVVPTFNLDYSFDLVRLPGQLR